MANRVSRQMEAQLHSNRVMDALTSTAAAGLRSRLEALDLLANNLANAQTTAFKADRELYRLYQSPDAFDASTDAAETHRQPDLPHRWTDFRQGPLTANGNPLDVALEGEGFFLVTDPKASGGPLLMTRDGHFRLHPVAPAPGYPEYPARLETTDGHVVLGNDRLPIIVNSRQELSIDLAGTIRQDGFERNRLFVVSASQSAAAAAIKRSGNYFSLDENASANTLTGAANTRVHQGHLEAANVEPAESAVRLVNVMRQFETLNRALQLGGEMNRKAVEEVARVS